MNTKLMGNNTSWLNSHYGNLGIGTQTADEKFQVRTGTNNFISFTDAQHGSLSTLGSAIIFSRPQDGAKKICGIFQHTNQSLGIGARDDLTIHTGGNAFYYSGSERLRIKSDGKVGIGSEIPAATLDLQSEDTEVLLRLNTRPIKNGYLDIVSDANRRGVIRFGDTDGTYRWSIGNGDSDELTNTSFHISSGNSGGGSAKFVIDSNGDVGINVANPGQKLHVDGSIKLTGQ
ncbi:MAG: hypothetical protein VXY93_16025, partial [Pseudomonadota bacterium]|nr:hypothetical protein [Pseudomonadota bacterium]